ncbi:AraC family transcriptional regulator [Paraburkholderia phenazinium]|jgi:AraC family transcriptional regulator|uniref:Transcriptional regulator, AraC family n=1 Tax=Paraburkholderia phenazinium TaxID=60549 RepID=A0A1G8N6M2_9BURK|nr:AraC family transcriptional regulator [Paraburkholderia phenazinium]SDI75736.1 transcriptional regulator, AraC family [Paraburkholderia phenazinium]
MDPIGKALWFIEIELCNELTLDRIAATCELSRFGLSRMFAIGTGWPVMRYVRARRLTRAARMLAEGAPDILSVALDNGYGSHEAFTRAFHDLFGVTPDELRSRRVLTDLPVVEPIRMKELKEVDLPAPRFETRGAFVIAGLSGRFTFETNEGIPALWQSFCPHIGHVPGQVGGITYGLCCNPGEDSSFEYVAGVEVRAGADLPASFRSIKVDPQRYAVFVHKGHVSTLHQTFYNIFNHWLPASDLAAAEAPEFERYSEDFDPIAGKGTVEVWVPVKDKASTHE